MGGAARDARATAPVTNAGASDDVNVAGPGTTPEAIMTTPCPLQPELERRAVLKPDRATFVECQTLHEEHAAPLSTRRGRQSAWRSSKKGRPRWPARGSTMHAGCCPSGLSFRPRRARLRTRQVRVTPSASRRLSWLQPSQRRQRSHRKSKSKTMRPNWCNCFFRSGFRCWSTRSRVRMLDRCVGFRCPATVGPTGRSPCWVRGVCAAAARSRQGVARLSAESGAGRSGGDISPTLHSRRMRNERQVASSHPLALASLRQQETYSRTGDCASLAV